VGCYQKTWMDAVQLLPRELPTEVWARSFPCPPSMKVVGAWDLLPR
jgi:hypothetical protein